MLGSTAASSTLAVATGALEVNQAPLDSPAPLFLSAAPPVFPAANLLSLIPSLSPSISTETDRSDPRPRSEPSRVSGMKTDAVSPAGAYVEASNVLEWGAEAGEEGTEKGPEVALIETGAFDPLTM